MFSKLFSKDVSLISILRTLNVTSTVLTSAYSSKL